ELLGDVLADELGVDLGPVDLLDLDLDPPAGEGLQLLLDALDLGPLAADDHAGPGREQDDLHRVASPLDLDLGEPGDIVLALDMLADLKVFDQQVLELVLVGVPAAPPVLVDADPVAGRADLLTHGLGVPFPLSAVAASCVPGPGGRLFLFVPDRPAVLA